MIIQPFTGAPVTISAEKVKEMEPQKSSVMPERILDGMNDEQIRDLFSYLMSIKR
jgi:hypothetical protein